MDMWITKRKQIIWIFICLFLLNSLLFFVGIEKKKFKLQHIKARDGYARISKSFNMSIYDGDEDVSQYKWRSSDDEILNSSVDIGLFIKYLYKKYTFQPITFKDFEPTWKILDDKKYEESSICSTSECIENFNNNLLYNPEFKDVKTKVSFDRPLTIDYIVENPDEVASLLRLLAQEVRKLDDLTDEKYPR